jgi:hypothetical protein
MFTEKFDSYVCEGDTIQTEIDGLTITATIERDQDYRIDDDDCHNPDQAVTGCSDKQFKKLLAARQAWFDDEWFYCGVVLSVEKNGVVLAEYAASLWGIEANYPGSDNSHLAEVANELLPEALEEGKRVLASLQS